jgi:hypothetical protein
VRGSDFLSSADPRVSGGCTINTPMPIYKERGKPSNNLHYLKLVLGNKSGQYIFFLHCTLRSHSCESSIGSMRPSLLLLCICIVSVAAWANRSNSSAGANGTISTDDNAAGGSSGGGGGGDVLWMHLASSTAATVPTGPRLRPTATLDRYALRYFSESMGGARDIANNYGSQVHPLSQQHQYLLPPLLNCLYPELLPFCMGTNSALPVRSHATALHLITAVQCNSAAHRLITAVQWVKCCTSPDYSSTVLQCYTLRSSKIFPLSHRRMLPICSGLATKLTA